MTAVTEAGMPTRARRGPDAFRATARQASDRNAIGAAAWRLALAMVGIDVVLVVWCLVLGAAIPAAFCAACAGFLAAGCRDARPTRNRGVGDLR